ncbi:hypothetical protein CA51_22650 [Rosistilla oblonga]|uniref:DUF4357 domain-containing protein n=1 Tax=Rosistilla oblonga TaxID=2527990 RepID=UPI001188FB5E|nr:DUF4357 domain-containing protein [Rosistilla oblonga]QDV12382.1 hypothetical protein CA51_22650 [Rosistilla oblonga]
MRFQLACCGQWPDRSRFSGTTTRVTTWTVRLTGAGHVGYTCSSATALVDEETLVGLSDQGLLQFAEDVYFNSPSAGAAIVAAGNTNGRIAWKIVGTRQTYGEWHQAQLPSDDDE